MVPWGIVFGLMGACVICIFVGYIMGKSDSPSKGEETPCETQKPPSQGDPTLS